VQWVAAFGQSAVELHRYSQIGKGALGVSMTQAIPQSQSLSALQSENSCGVASTTQPASTSPPVEPPVLLPEPLVPLPAEVASLATPLVDEVWAVVEGVPELLPLAASVVPRREVVAPEALDVDPPDEQALASTSRPKRAEEWGSTEPI
jgi:hypothetical protein